MQGASSIGSVLPSLTGEAPTATAASPQQSANGSSSTKTTGIPTLPSRLPRNGVSHPPNGLATADRNKGKANGSSTAADAKVADAKPATGEAPQEQPGKSQAAPDGAAVEGSTENAHQYVSQGESIQPQKPLGSMFSAMGGSTLADTAALPTLAELQGGGRVLGSRPSGGGTSSGGRTADSMQEAARLAVDGVSPSRSPPPGGKPPLSPGRGTLPQVREADMHAGNPYLALHGVINDTMSSGMLSGMLSGPVSYNDSIAATPRDDAAAAEGSPGLGPPARPLSPPTMRPASPQQQHTAPLWPTAAYTGEESVLSIDGDPGGDADTESLAVAGAGVPVSSMGGFSGMPDPSAMSVDTAHLDAGATSLTHRRSALACCYSLL